jgi:hypothetical protein
MGARLSAGVTIAARRLRELRRRRHGRGATAAARRCVPPRAGGGRGGDGSAWLAVAAGVLITFAAASPPARAAASGKDKTTRPAVVADAVVEADIDLTDGPGAPAAAFKLRGRTLTAVFPRAEDGNAAGVFKTTLGAGDALLAELALLPDGAAGAALTPDLPAATFVVRRKSGQRRFVTA